VAKPAPDLQRSSSNANQSTNSVTVNLKQLASNQAAKVQPMLDKNIYKLFELLMDEKFR
jgi:hypothetical protein